MKRIIFILLSIVILLIFYFLIFSGLVIFFSIIEVIDMPLKDIIFPTMMSPVIFGFTMAIVTNRKKKINNKKQKQLIEPELIISYEKPNTQISVNNNLEEISEDSHLQENIESSQEPEKSDLKIMLLQEFKKGTSLSEIAKKVSEKTGQSFDVVYDFVEFESAIFNEDSNFRAYEAAGIEQYQFWAEHELTVCPICAGLDGKIFNVKDRKIGVNAPPMHKGCHCITVEYDPYEKEDYIDSGLEPPEDRQTWQEWYDGEVKRRGKDAVENEIKIHNNKADDEKQFKKYKKLIADQEERKNLDEIRPNMSFDEMFDISNEVLDLLWIKGGKYSNYNSEIDNEPSLINIDYEIDTFVCEDDYKEDIGYFPSYKNLSPKHRYVYLKWLEDITKPIPVGYVFIFYYGLERHLLFGKFEQSFEMVIKLRKYHSNNSFFAYSSNSLLISSLKRKKVDFLSRIDLENASKNVVVLVIGMLNGKYTANNLISICKDVGFTNTRYIKNDTTLFINTLNEILIKRFDEPFYSISKEDFLEAKDVITLAVANYSLKHKERFENAPDITTNPKFRKEIFELLNKTHEEVKLFKRELRKKL